MTVLLVVAALACLAGEALNVPEVVYVAKPVATLAIFAMAARTRDPVSPQYRMLISAGLIASLGGDVLLMLPNDLFLAGLASFVVAHLCYMAAFVTAGGGQPEVGVAAVLIGVAVAMVAYVWPGLDGLHGPVIVYALVIAVMAWQAIARWRSVGDEAAALAAGGAVLFMLSDSALAIRRFRLEFPFASLVVLGTYWAAQWCIARSVARVPARA